MLSNLALGLAPPSPETNLVGESQPSGADQGEHTLSSKGEKPASSSAPTPLASSITKPQKNQVPIASSVDDGEGTDADSKHPLVSL